MSSKMQAFRFSLSGFFILILGILFVPKLAFAQVVSLSPSSQNVDLGQGGIAVDVVVDQVSNLYGASLHLTYNPNLVTLASSAKGVFLSENNTVNDLYSIATSTIDVSTNDIIIGFARDVISGVSTTSTTTLTRLYFNATSNMVGYSFLTFRPGLNRLRDPDLVEIPTTYVSGGIGVLDDALPTTPGNPVLVPVSPIQIDLSWSSSTDNFQLSGYKIFRDGAIVGTSNIASFSNTGLTPSTTYAYEIVAYDSSGNDSATSSLVSTSTPADTTAPSVPDSLVASVISPTQINLSWASSTDLLGVSAYQVNLDNVAIATTTAINYQYTGLTASTSYVLSVLAYDAAGNYSATSSPLSTTTHEIDITAPAVPGSFIASAISSTQISLAWASSTDNVAVIGYQVYRNSTSSANLLGTSTAISFTDSSLAAASLYQYFIRAFDARFNFSEFATSSATTQAAPVVSSGGGGGGGGGGSFTPIDSVAPGKPTNIKAEPGDGRIRLSWTNPTDTDLAGVTIMRSESMTSPVCATSTTDLRSKMIYQAKGTLFTDAGLNNGLKYCYAFFAYDAKPNYSAVVSIVAQPTISATAINADNGSGTATTTAGGSGTSGASGGYTGGSLANADGATSDRITLDEAAVVYNQGANIPLTPGNAVIYAKIMAQTAGTYEIQAKRALAFFIQDGTPTTRILGAGERAGAVGSYISTFGRLPSNVADWQDAVKIANGRWPKARNAAAESAAEKVFKKIYLRAPKRTTIKYDDNAVVIIAYGLRPATRNTASEKAAIKSFKYIYNRQPTKANDWDIVRAIAYSGAKR